MSETEIRVRVGESRDEGEGIVREAEMSKSGGK
jgi:hypothetical protein